MRKKNKAKKTIQDIIRRGVKGLGPMEFSSVKEDENEDDGVDQIKE